MIKKILIILLSLLSFLSLNSKAYTKNSFLNLEKSGLPFSLTATCNENIKKIKIKENNLLVFKVKNKQIGKCKSDKKNKTSKLFVETFGLIKDKNHELNFDFKPEEGMEGLSFLKLEDWTPKCQNVKNPFTLRFNEHGIIEAGLRIDNKMVYYNTESNLNDYINKWNQLYLKIENLDHDRLNLEVLINNQKIFQEEIKINKCNKIMIAFGLDEQIKSSNAKFHEIKFKNFKLLSGPLTKCNFIKNSKKKLKIMLVGDSQIGNGSKYKCNILASELSYNLKNSIDVFVESGSGYISKDINLERAKSFSQLTKNKNLSDYDWIIWISGADLNALRETKGDLLIKRVDKIISKNLNKGYLLDTFNFSQNKDTKLIISLTSDMSENLKTKKYMNLINSGQKLIKRYSETANKYENVFFLPIQNYIDKDDENLYTDKYDGVHYSDKAMQILVRPLIEIIKEN